MMKVEAYVLEEEAMNWKWKHSFNLVFVMAKVLVLLGVHDWNVGIVCHMKNQQSDTIYMPMRSIKVISYGSGIEKLLQ